MVRGPARLVVVAGLSGRRGKPNHQDGLEREREREGEGMMTRKNCERQ